MKKIYFSPENLMTEKIINPPEPSYKRIPEWYKKIKPRILNHNVPRHHESGYNMTVKMCNPVLDALSSGYMVTLPCDIFCTTKKEYGYRFMWEVDWEPITMHSELEIDGFPLPHGYEKYVAKFNNSWKIKTPDGYSCLVTHPMNRFDLPFFTLSAIIDTDKHPIPLNFPFCLKEGFEGVIPEGTPIAQILPFKRENWKGFKEKYKEENNFWKNDLKKTIEFSYKKRFRSEKKYL